MAQDIDVFATLCELIGAELPLDRKIDGKSILALLRKGSEESPHQYLFHQWNRVRPLMTPLPTPPPATLGPADREGFHLNWAVRNRRGYKLVVTSSRADAMPQMELFDLENDPGETEDISAQHSDIVLELRGEFEKWFTDVTAGQDYASRVPIEVGRQDENPVEFPEYVLWAEPVGKKVQPNYHEGTGDTIDHWSEVSDFVRWKIEVVQSGHYEVILNYGCRPSDAGSRLLIQAGNSEVEHVVRSTGGRTIFQSRVVGTLQLDKGLTTLAIKPLSIAGRELFALHKIWLNKLP